jgi:hypothetical protein
MEGGRLPVPDAADAATADCASASSFPKAKALVGLAQPDGRSLEGPIPIR